MNGRPPSRWALTLLLTATLLILTACTGVGIFAHIAVSDKIDKGLLPGGTSASSILQITAEYPNTKYDYFSSGSRLFRRDTTVRKTVDKVWEPVALPSGWTNIQSIAASEERLLLALAKESGGALTVGLFYYEESGTSTGFRQINGAEFVANDSGYKTILVYCPNPAGSFYVNVLSFTGDFGQDASFTGSEIYTLSDTDTNWNNPIAKTGWELSKSYVSSAAYSGTSYRFTTVNPSTKTGLLVDEDGKTVYDTIIPSTGLTWLPSVDVSSAKGAFIMSSMISSEGSYSVYVNTDNEIGAEGNWISLSSSYRFGSFLDITTTQGGGVHKDSTKLVLAGTRSVGDSRGGNGYMEIDVSDTDPKKWSIRTDRSSFTFADRTNYESGNLVASSLVGFSLFKENGTDSSYIYASTDKNGVWRINADGYTGDTSRPGWSGE